MDLVSIARLLGVRISPATAPVGRPIAGRDACRGIECAGLKWSGHFSPGAARQTMTTTLRLADKQHEAENVTSFLFEPEAPISYQAGQYLRYTLPHAAADSRGIARTFSIASFPAEPTIRIATRLSTPSSTFKQALAALEPPATLQASGPYGRFVFSDAGRPAVFIAGGIGITPFRSILGDLAARRVSANVVLLYSNRTANIPFRGFLDGLVTDLPELRIVYTVTQPNEDWHGPTGRIDSAFIKRRVENLAEPVFFVSGPTGLVEAMRATLAEIGVDAARTKYEAFPGYDR
jgi:ferredoxin-NADP reductase